MVATGNDTPLYTCKLLRPEILKFLTAETDDNYVRMDVLTNFFVVISLQYACVPHHCAAYVSYTMLCISYISVNWRQQNQYKRQEQVGYDLCHLPKRKY